MINMEYGRMENDVTPFFSATTCFTPNRKIFLLHCEKGSLSENNKDYPLLYFVLVYQHKCQV